MKFSSTDKTFWRETCKHYYEKDFGLDVEVYVACTVDKLCPVPLTKRTTARICIFAGLNLAILKIHLIH